MRRRVCAGLFALVGIVCLSDSVAAASQPMQSVNEGDCVTNCKLVGLVPGAPIDFSVTFEMETYEEGAPFYKASILDWAVYAGDFHFSKAEAQASRIDDHAVTGRSYWRQQDALPFFSITASERVGELGRYVNIVAGEEPYSFQVTLGYFACQLADCSGPEWDGSGELASGGYPALAPVPLPPALALMAPPLMGLAWLKRRRKREGEA